MIGASGQSDDDDGKNDGLKLKLSDRIQSASGITFLPLVRYRHFKNSRVYRRINRKRILLHLSNSET